MPVPQPLSMVANLLLGNALSGSISPMVDLFSRNQPGQMRQTPDQPATSPTPSSSSGSGNTGQGSPTSGLSPQAMMQASLLAQALGGGGQSFLPNLGNAFNAPVQSFGLFPTLGQLPGVLGPIQSGLNSQLTGNQSIAALFSPMSYSMGQLPAGQGGESQWAPVLQQSAASQALAALMALMLGGGGP